MVRQLVISVHIRARIYRWGSSWFNAPHSTSWPFLPAPPRRAIRHPPAVLPQYNDNDASALRLLDFLRMASATSPTDPGKVCHIRAITIGEKGTNFAAALITHRDFAKARQIVRIHKRPMAYKMGEVTAAEDERRGLLGRYKDRVQVCRRSGRRWRRCDTHVYNSSPL